MPRAAKGAKKSRAAGAPPAGGGRAPGGDDVPRRDAVLDAALALFSEFGFHGTAVPLIAERAGVGMGTVYRYFPSKEVLVNVLYRQLKAQLGRFLLAGLPPDEDDVREIFHYLWT